MQPHNESLTQHATDAGSPPPLATHHSPLSTPPLATPLDRQSFTLGALGLTAVVLFVGLMLSWERTPRAYAIGQNASGGDFVMLTQQFNNSQESLIVVDAAANRLIVYGYDYSRRVLLPVDGFDLRNLNKRPDPKTPITPGRR